jgi:hypothetical protein
MGSTMDNEIKRDTARFDGRQWYVDGYASHFFTSREDAEAALALARQVKRNAESELCNEIRNRLPR